MWVNEETYSGVYMAVDFIRLGSGWSVHTNKTHTFHKNEGLSDMEQEQIMRVIKRAETLESVEQERVGLVSFISMCSIIFLYTSE